MAKGLVLTTFELHESKPRKKTQKIIWLAFFCKIGKDYQPFIFIKFYQMKISLWTEHVICYIFLPPTNEVRGKVMFLLASVILSTGEGVSVWGVSGQRPPPTDLPVQ